MQAAAIRTAIVGGEAITVAHLKTLEERCPGIRVFNEYGPTEATIGAVAGYVSADDIHIGKPYANTRVYVLDATLQPCPLGVVGELYIAGIGLARGYWNRPALTAERFIANPFALEPGERLYRTGDLASWRDDGNLLFHGRADQQVKIQGYRIEPGEIEATLLREPEIDQAAVIAREDRLGEKRLIAYVVAHKDEQGQRATIDPSELRQHLTTHLPEYMVPSAFAALDALPLTPNGKLDRKALPALDDCGFLAAYVAPRTPEETLLCDLVAQLLGRDRVGLADDFFRLGGHSLLAARLAAQIRARLDRELPIRTIFEHPILGDLARQIGLVTDSTTAFNVLLPIRKTGSLPPLFCMHPVGGLCWPYANLVRHTSAEQPIYGIQARGFADDLNLPAAVEDVISESIEQIRSVRPRGPYKLLGWSFGGILAHMVASRLQAEGEIVERLILFDSYPPSVRLSNEIERRRLADGVWRDLAMGTDLTLPADMQGSAVDAETIFTLAREQSHILGSLPFQQLERMGAIMANNSAIMSRDTPPVTLGRFHGDILLYVVTRRAPDFNFQLMNPQAWEPYCTGAVRTIAIDSTHNRMLSPDALKQMGILPL
jgi:thioesterase domain-containing protein